MQHTNLHVKCSVEAHLQMTLSVFIEHSKETLFEDRRGEGVGQNDDTICRVGKRSHLEQSDLVEATSKQVYSMSILRGAFRKAFVKLQVENYIR
jgi:ribosomal protein L16/L10AE